MTSPIPQSMVNLITHKRDGGILSDSDIRWMIEGYVRNEIPDYQISSWLMAVYLRGMDRDETVALTRAMIESGDVIDLSPIPGIKVDKHSTGGVGDKISLILAPLVAAAGVPVPMMSGRGLGHTGGTLDKLESIPGFRTALDPDMFIREIREIGFAMMGQTETIAPADRKMYALRDVTATVSSIPLIASSIMSKKKAEGADALVCDVKVGKGAFCPTLAMARNLARTLVDIGEGLSVRTVAFLSAMDEPLGHSAGNWLEVEESVQALSGRGPSDVMELVRVLGGAMLVLGGRAKTLGQGMAAVDKAVDSGEGLRRFAAMTAFQGGDASVLRTLDPGYKAPCRESLASPKDGYVESIDAGKIGWLAVDLGAGRHRKEDVVDPSAGIRFFKKKGDRVAKGETVAVLYTDRKFVLEESKRRLAEAVTFSASPPRMKPLIIECIDDEKQIVL